MHVAMVAAFLVVAHVAMIFGMVDPAVLGRDTSSSVMAHDMGSMSGMNHDMGSMNHNMSPVLATDEVTPAGSRGEVES